MELDEAIKIVETYIDPADEDVIEAFEEIKQEIASKDMILRVQRDELGYHARVKEINRDTNK